MPTRNTILMALPLESDLGRDIFRGAQESIARHSPPQRWRLIDSTPEYMRLALNNPAMQNTLAGVIAFAYLPEIEQWLLDSRLPVVNVSARLTQPRLPTVTSDNEAVGRLAAEHLLGCGLTNFVFVGSESTGFAAERHQGFAAALAKVGRGCVRSGIQAGQLRRKLPRMSRPFGVFCSSDRWVSEVFEALEQLRWTVPNDVAVLGCDNDMLYCATSPVALSSVALDGRRIGQLAAQMLFELMQSGSPPAAPIRVPPAGVVSRASTEVVSLTNPQLSAALQVIRARACEPLAVDDLSRAIHMTRRTLERLFRRELQRSVREEILRTRLHRACQLLRETEQSVGTVARAAGFADYGRFTRAFRLAQGTTPSQYRSRFRRV